MYERILVRYGDLNLKGKNKKVFSDRIDRLIREKLAAFPVSYDFRHDRMFVILNGVESDAVMSRLDRVSGLYSYSPITKCAVDLDEIAKTAVSMIERKTGGKATTFKVETKRADKQYPQTSQEVSRELARRILPSCPNLAVEVHDPELVLSIEIRPEGAYLFTEQIRAMGGYPVGIGGKGLLMLSGGIDSPVAGYLAMKQGVEIECLHFESTPLTAIESVQKAIDIVEILSDYAPYSKMKLHLVPFEPIHQKIIEHIPESFIITVMRRMMYRIAEKVALRHDCLCVLNGESIGQVASQTIESMDTIGSVCDVLVLRPLATYDKIDIISVARKIGTFDISNRAFEDCCTVYLPKNPVIRPSRKLALHYETFFDYEPLVTAAIEGVKTLTLTPREHFDIASKGLVVKEALDA
ncbi:MAG TPA: tRNA 4-thiouridine(8) synthase ThiI [Acholeplasmatales bacterium]|nr:MAG: tRNA 4-thiouridine(8) synthase ThiI [Tenericutes bacterium GWF2_57_13]HAQ56145.1 tRNA 4-thiouridine(8) synthase ThiI [Acholeplasmatales bacterium]